MIDSSDRALLVGGAAAPATTEKKPRFQHDCEHCTFLGHFKDHDLYHCEVGSLTLVARYGGDPEAYISGFEFHRTEPAIAIAYELAKNAGLNVTPRA